MTILEMDASTSTFGIVSSDGMEYTVRTRKFRDTCLYAEGLLRCEMTEASEGRVQLTYPQRSLRPIIRTLQGKKIRLNKKNVAPVLEVAMYFGVLDLVQRCINFLKYRVADSTMECLDLSDTYSIREVREEVMRDIVSRPTLLKGNSQFCRQLWDKLGHTVVCDLLRRNELAVTHEDDVADIVISWWRRWASAEPPLRPQCREEAEQLFQCIRLGLLSPAKARDLRQVLDASGIQFDSMERCHFGDFSHLPAELTSHRDATSHLHILWSDRLNDSDGPVRNSVCCVRCAGSSESVLESTPSLAHVDKEPMYTTVGGRILRATTTGPLELTIDAYESREDFSTWAEKIKVPLGSRRGHIAIAPEGESRCVISWESNEGPQVVALNVNSWQIEHQFELVPGRNLGDIITSPSVREFLADGDMAALLRNAELSTVERSTGRVTQLMVPDTGLLVSMARVGDQLYVYNDRGDTFGYEYKSVQADRIFIVDLPTNVVVREVLFDHGMRSHCDVASNLRCGRVRHLVNWRGELLLIAQDNHVPICAVFRFDLVSETMHLFAHIPIQRPGDVDSGTQEVSVFYRTFCQVLPFSQHLCSHTHWMDINTSEPR